MIVLILLLLWIITIDGIKLKATLTTKSNSLIKKLTLTDTPEDKLMAFGTQFF